MFVHASFLNPSTEHTKALSGSPEIGTSAPELDNGSWVVCFLHEHPNGPSRSWFVLKWPEPNQATAECWLCLSALRPIDQPEELLVKHVIKHPVGVALYAMESVHSVVAVA